jgi:hypothetical protein
MNDEIATIVTTILISMGLMVLVIGVAIITGAAVLYLVDLFLGTAHFNWLTALWVGLSVIVLVEVVKMPRKG